MKVKHVSFTTWVNPGLSNNCVHSKGPDSKSPGSFRLEVNFVFPLSQEEEEQEEQQPNDHPRDGGHHWDCLENFDPFGEGDHPRDGDHPKKHLG